MKPKKKEKTAKQAKVKPEKTRRCLVSGDVRPADDLIRFVIGPDGDVVPDLKAILPGRGIWVTANRALLEHAAAKNLFARSAKQAVTVPDDFVPRVEALLVKRCLEYCGLAQRAGQVVTGFEKVRAALRQKDIAVLFEASDGQDDGRKKVMHLAKALDQSPLLIGCFNRLELGLAFGRETVVHAALETGDIAQKIQRETARLAGFRPLSPQLWVQDEHD